jgi:hypothetical protein
MTAYRSTNTYRQDLLRYDGGTNVIVAPATIAATSTAPAVTVTEGAGVTVAAVTIAATTTVPAVQVFQSQTINLDTIGAVAAVPAVTVTEGAGVAVTPGTVAATSTAPAVTVTEGAGVTVNVATVSGSGLIPDPTVTEGTGVAVTPAAVAATSTVPDPTVTEGTGVTVARPQIAATSTVPPLDISMRYVPTIENILPQIDVVPYHTNDPARRLARFRTPGARGRNIFILTSGAVTTRQPGDPTTISRTLLGGHESPTDLTSDEFDALIGAGYNVEVR